MRSKLFIILEIFLSSFVW